MVNNRKRTKPKQKLSPIQENRFLKIVVALILVALLWLLFSPGSGLISLWKKRAELKESKEQLVGIAQENEQLKKDIEQLQKDSAVIEKIARKDLNMLKRNEKVFDFSSQKPAKE